MVIDYRMFCESVHYVDKVQSYYSLLLIARKIAFEAGEHLHCHVLDQLINNYRTIEGNLQLDRELQLQKESLQ